MNFQLNILKFFQSLRNPILNAFFLILTISTEVPVVVLLTAIMYWCINKKYGQKLLFALIPNIVINTGIKELVKELKKDYEDESRGLRIDFLGNRFKITTKFEHKEYYQKLLENPETSFLSQSALETLAIIAYNEPVTRMQVEALRGVGSVQIIRKLVAKGFVKEVGRSELPGRPILYETTSEFLDYFGLSTIEDLPDMKEFINKSEEVSDDNTDLYTSKYKENSDEEN